MNPNRAVTLLVIDEKEHLPFRDLVELKNHLIKLKTNQNQKLSFKIFSFIISL